MIVSAKKYFPETDHTLMEDPEERLDVEILNGVALRPRVSSETDTDKIDLHRCKTENKPHITLNSGGLSQQLGWVGRG